MIYWGKNRFSLTSISLPNSVTSIGNNAFGECSSLESITLPKGIISIGHHAFCECNSMKSISFQDNVESIGLEAFDQCDKLESITFSSGNSHYKSIDGVLFNKDGSKLILYPTGKKETTYIIPDGVRSFNSKTMEVNAKEFLEVMKKIQKNLLNFLEHGNNDEEQYQNLIKIFDDIKIHDNQFKIKP